MTRITDLAKLKAGDKVYIFGTPFVPWVHKLNPFIMEERVFSGHNIFRSIFRSTVKPEVEQVCGWLRKDTFIFIGELTVEDEAELILASFEGLINE